ncbi:RNA-directed DNA polymerase, eukaryota, reverse transcriptase zinc-binding domain protein [Tanacetum coccineum]
MRSQRQSKVPSKFDDTIHNINNSKNNKNKSVSKNKSNDKNCDNNKDLVSRDGENIVNLETEREEEEVNNVEDVVNKEGDTRDDYVNGDEHVADSKNIEGLFGSGVHEVHSSSTPDSNANIDDNLSKSGHSSYASMVKNDDIPNSLDFIPTVITETGNEVVICDEEIVKQGNIDKWKNEIRMTKVESKKLYVWVKINNVPLEAWCVKGISAMASSLGKPILMDTVTATMCHKGISSLGYARVLIEMDAEKEIKSEIEIQYVDKNNNIKGTKKIQALYDWKPPKCSHCRVFGHETKSCKKETEEVNNNKGDNSPEVGKKKGSDEGKKKDGTDVEFVTQGRKKQQWNDFKNNGKHDDNYSEIQKLKERMIVDKFLNEKIQPTLLESITWSNDMIKYFKDKWVDDKMPKDTGNIEEDVLEINNGTANVMGDQDIRGFERRLLWVDLENEKRYVNGNPWCLSGDMNVTLHPNEHSSGSSIMTADIVMSNMDFIGHYPKAHAKFLPYIISDHSPSVLCNEINGTLMYQVVQKIKKLKSPLNHLGWCKGSIFKRVISLREQLQKIQTEIDGDPHNPSLREMEANLVKEFHEAEADEEKFLFQQAKIKWLSEGDKNSSFFHKVLKGRSNKSKILSLCDSNGVYHDEDQIPGLFLRHYEDFLGTTYPVQVMENCDDLFKTKISPEAANKMVTEFSENEIKIAMFDIEDSKAPGLDGYSSAFFKKAWKVIGSDVCNAVREFFRNGRMLGEVNATLISLIPKVQTPSKVTDFRPIACCNVFYKCISKALTNRIKPVLSKLVSSNQSAFIPGRSIQDNILLTQEVMKGYNRKGGPKRVAFKIDLQKAYDTISWSFLKKTLEEFGFHEKMGGRGLRQGDPISPYLFTLIMEVFTLMLDRQIEKDNNFQYHFGCKAIKLTYVCFADDLLVMCHGDPKSVEVIKNTLDEFSACSGRLQPIDAVLESIHVYWASVFLLPITIIQDINRLLKWFLWNQGEAAKGKAKVSWENVCKPKKQGGLGLKDLHIWNKALLAKHVWNIATKKNSLWVKWVHSVKLREKNIWEISTDVNDSWGWKNLLCIRDLIRDNVKHIIVSEMMRNDLWRWPNEWNEKSLIFRNLVNPNLKNGVKDKVVWRNKDGKDMEFSVSIANNDMCEQGQDIAWWKLNRLSTQDKFKNWGDYAINRCCLCCQDAENLNHLMFQCSFSKEIWNKISLLAEIKTNRAELMGVIQFLSEIGNKNNIKSIVRRIAFAACLYGIWNERNSRIFKDSKRSYEEVLKSIIEIVRNKLMSLMVKDSTAVRSIEQIWAISMRKMLVSGVVVVIVFSGINIFFAEWRLGWLYMWVCVSDPGDAFFIAIFPISDDVDANVIGSGLEGNVARFGRAPHVL